MSEADCGIIEQWTGWLDSSLVKFGFKIGIVFDAFILAIQIFGTFRPPTTLNWAATFSAIVILPICLMMLGGSIELLLITFRPPYSDTNTEQ